MGRQFRRLTPLFRDTLRFGLAAGLLPPVQLGLTFRFRPPPFLGLTGGLLRHASPLFGLTPFLSQTPRFSLTRYLFFGLALAFGLKPFLR